MKELSPLLEKMAEKLGTTVEMLWDVLLKQAMIDGAAKLLVCVTLTCLTIFCFRLVQRKTKTPPATQNDPHPCAEWEPDNGGFLAWIGVFVITCFLIISYMFFIPDIFAAFLNPQYWALKQILGVSR